MTNDEHGDFRAVFAVIPNLQCYPELGQEKKKKPDSDLTSFEVIGVQLSLKFGCHTNTPILIFWGTKVIASDTARVRKPSQCCKEP